MFDLLSPLAFPTSIALAGVWAIRLEGRVNLQEERITALKELIVERLNKIDRTLDRIEDKK